MSRARFESIIMSLPQDVVDELRIRVDAERLIDCLFGEGMGEEDLEVRNNRM